MRALFPLLFVQASWLLCAADAGEVLYNGIVLPDQWPPTRTSEEFKNREPQPVPYLKDPPAVLPVDLGRLLFVDDFLIESTTLRREFHLAEMHPGNPVLQPDVPAEAEGRQPMAMPFSDGVWFDPHDHLFKMWYMAGYGKQTALATSRDGLHWEKPVFDVRAGTNVVQPEARDSSTVWLDLEDPDPARRYKMWRSHSEDKRFGLSLQFSADGIHWGPRALRTGSNGDRSTVFRNPFRKVWVYSLRHGWGQPRARRYWEARDLLESPQWSAISDPPLWLISDQLDPPREDLQVEPQLYNFDAVAYESLMLGLFTIWRGDLNIPPGRPKPNSIFLGFSRDGFHFDRPDRRPFIPVSEKQGDWNWGNVQSVGGCCLIVGDQLWFYFSGRAGGSDGKTRDGSGATGLARLRRDGFASMNAGASGGTLTTRLLTFAGKHLFVNANAADGELRAEVLDRDGKVIAPFTKGNCEPVRTDSTRVEVRWKGADDLSVLGQHPVRLFFSVSKGALYSFWFAPDRHGASHGYVAAGGPSFDQPTDTAGTPDY
ncbi:MAG: hypothetical protein QOE70_743 [Chthoniobacter sp.]|jgi:hypothetical protein|nr:hypothetical protein [Chthoniobacter sp.]